MIRPGYLLDTNICIQIRRQRPQVILRRFQALTRGDAVISVITYGELRYGAEKSEQRVRALALLQELLTLLPVQPLPADAGEAYGRIRADLERRGMMIGNNDLWIAAHGQSAGLTVVTNNDREFRRVPDLLVENWAEPIR